MFRNAENTQVQQDSGFQIVVTDCFSSNGFTVLEGGLRLAEAYWVARSDDPATGPAVNQFADLVRLAI